MGKRGLVQAEDLYVNWSVWITAMANARFAGLLGRWERREGSLGRKTK
jgi:hypothetical protein